MKIFINMRKNPTIKFYYNVLSYLMAKGSRAEINDYLNAIENYNKGIRKNIDFTALMQ